MNLICVTFHTITHQHWWHFRYLQDVGDHTNTPEERQEKERDLEHQTFDNHALCKT